MNKDMETVDFLDTLPLPLKQDEGISWLAKVIGEELRSTFQVTEQNIIYGRIEELDEQVLDLLAQELNLDWYDVNDSLDVKRKTLRDGTKVNRHLGTKYAMEKAIGNVYPGSKVVEWFEYDGEPFHFKINIDLSKNGLQGKQQQQLAEKVDCFKNLRSRLETIDYTMKNKGLIFSGGYHTLENTLAIFPYVVEDLESFGKVKMIQFCKWSYQLAVFPWE